MQVEGDLSAWLASARLTKTQAAAAFYWPDRNLPERTGFAIAENGDTSKLGETDRGSCCYSRGRTLSIRSHARMCKAGTGDLNNAIKDKTPLAVIVCGTAEDSVALHVFSPPDGGCLRAKPEFVIGETYSSARPKWPANV